MKILVIGGGGREHAVIWKLHQEGGRASAGGLCSGATV